MMMCLHHEFLGECLVRRRGMLRYLRRRTAQGQRDQRDWRSRSMAGPQGPRKGVPEEVSVNTHTSVSVRN